MYPHFPYIHPFRYSVLAPYPEDMKWFYWYACHCYTIDIQFKLVEMLRFFRRHAIVRDMINYSTEDRNSDTHFIQFHKWFKPLQQWEELFTEETRRVQPMPYGERHVIVLFQQMWYVGPPMRKSTRAQARAQGEPSEFQRTYSSKVWQTLLTDILDNDDAYR
ncbi:hypothetical protein CDL15_Pgr026869 [Punica granatum]|uniref:Uncharacterized protein n=1 Tax=Punica granatum TaxID=22663 RepID=A0A218WLT8_PUNGR|nr:hypothetical protein CDL15_Pgr026869 [Punica granatum]